MASTIFFKLSRILQMKLVKKKWPKYHREIFFWPVCPWGSIIYKSSQPKCSGVASVDSPFTLPTVIVRGVNFRNLYFLPGISIYYDPQFKKFEK